MADQQDHHHETDETGARPDASSSGAEQDSSGAEQAANSGKARRPPRRRRRRRWGRWLVGGIVVLIVVVGVLFALLPTILSTGAGNSFVLKQINGRIAGRATADHIDLAWFGGQSARGVTLRDPQGKTVAVVDKLDAPDAGLISLASGSRKLGDVRVVLDHADIVKRADGSINLQRALASPKHKPKKPNKPQAPKPGPTSSRALGKLSMRLHATGQRITYASPKLPTIVLSKLDAVMDMPDPTRIQLVVRGDVSQSGRAGGGGRPGEIDAAFTVRNALSSQGRVQVDHAAIQGKAGASRVPTALFAAVLKRDQLVPMLGSTVSATLSLNYQPGRGGELGLDMKSPHAAAHLAGLVTADRQLHLRQPATARLDVTPQVSQVMLRRLNPVLASAGSASLPLKLVIDKKNFTVPLTHFDWAKVRAAARLATGNLTLQPRGFTGRVVGLLDQVNVLKKQPSYRAKISPVNFAVNRGVLSYDHLRLSLSGVSLGFAGKVHLKSKQLNLTMALGGEQVNKVKALRGLTLPIAGTFNKPSIPRDALVNALATQAIQKGAGEKLPPQAQDVLGQILNQGGGRGQGGGASNQNKPQKSGGANGSTSPNQQQGGNDDAVGRLLNLGGSILEQQLQKQKDQQKQHKRRGGQDQHQENTGQ